MAALFEITYTRGGDDVGVYGPVSGLQAAIKQAQRLALKTGDSTEVRTYDRSELRGGGDLVADVRAGGQVQVLKQASGSLRAQTIRLAATMPVGSEQRRLLLAAVKEARGEKTTAMANDKVRVTWSDHPDNTLVVQELPTKPVKRRLHRRSYSTYYMVQWFHPGSVFLMTNLLREAKLSSSMNYDQAVAAIDEALEKAKQEVLENGPHSRFPAKYPEYTEADFDKLGYPRNVVRDETVNFLEVEPADYKPVQFAGKDFGGTAEWGSFKFYAVSDKDEYMSQNEGMSAFSKSKSPGGARKLFKLLKADPDAVKNMSVSQFEALLNKSGIGVDYVPTVWR